MVEIDKWEYLISLDGQFLKGGVILSERTVFITREADAAYANGAYLASIITALAGIETHLRSESFRQKRRLVDLIEAPDLEDDLKQELQALRRFRNRCVHVDDPRDDDTLLESPEAYHRELEEVAMRCAVAYRRTIYSRPCV